MPRFIPRKSFRRTNKFHVAPVEQRTRNGIVWDSKNEMHMWEHLERIIPSGQLHRQVEFLLFDKFQVGDERIRAIKYVADIVIGNLPAELPITPQTQGVDQLIVLDVKGFVTPEFKLKRKLFMLRFGIPLRLIGGRATTRKRGFVSLGDVVAEYRARRQA